MADRSAIEWTEATWNPVTGCSKVSPGCAHCYAETFAERFHGVPGHPYEQGFGLCLSPARLEQPLRWRRPRMIFVNSMSDLFREDIPEDFLHAIFEVMVVAEQHTFQILTNRAGEITKDDLDLARRAAREVDEPDSRIRCIVSVLMLREGWDVRNVCVIVTLRPLSAANRILPEQALGRGLRRMTPPGSGFDERVVVIEHEAFRNLWSTELDGGLIVEKEDADKIEPGAVTIFPDETKRRFDIVIPQLTRALARSDSALNQLHPADVPDPKSQLAVPEVQPDEYVQYRGVHLIDKGVIEEYEFHVPTPRTPRP